MEDEVNPFWGQVGPYFQQGNCHVLALGRIGLSWNHPDLLPGLFRESHHTTISSKRLRASGETLMVELPEGLEDFSIRVPWPPGRVVDKGCGCS